MNILKIFLVFLLLSCIVKTEAQKFNPPFFVFEDGLWNAKSDAPAYWADLVKTSGFDGVELIGLDKLDGMLPELKKNNLKLLILLFYICTRIMVDVL